MQQPALSPVDPAPVHSVSTGSLQWPFVPRVRLYTEAVVVDRGELLRPELREVTLPVLSLAFEYDGGTVRPSGNGLDFDASSEDLASVDGRDERAVPALDGRIERHHRDEARAQRLLEGFGAVEIATLDDYFTAQGSRADYLLQVEDNVHAACSFSAHAVPRLRELGFEVEIDSEYPFQVVDPKAPWYSQIEDAKIGDWFSLELGIELDGQRVNLLPALVELLRAAPDASSLRALERMGGKFRVVRVGENRYLPLPPERLTALLDVLIDLYDGCPNANLEPVFQHPRALCLARLDRALGGGQSLRWVGGAERIERARTFAEGVGNREVRVAADLRASLRPYQLEGLAWLQHLRTNDVGGVLADDMGLGKTLQTIAHLALEKESRRLDRPCLIVLPTSLVGNWERELVKFAPHLRTLVFHGPGRHRHRPFERYDVVLTTYPVLIRDVERLKATEYHIVVLDEAQAIKNHRSRANRAANELTARHRLCLTGTPLENNLDELWSLFDFLSPGLLGDPDSFRTRFRHPIERDGNEQQLSLLRQRVAPFVLRRTKEQVARDLPPKTVLVRPVELRGSQRELYESIRVAAHAEVRSLIRKKGLNASTVAILDALMKLRQVCCDPRLVPVQRARSVEESAKFELLSDMLDQNLRQGRRILVFSQFARMLALISEDLLRRGIRHTTLTGATRDRQAAIDTFQNGKADVFLVSLKAGGTGLNLTRADTVIHYEPWWNPAAQAQATDRAYRIGQTNPVFVYNLIVAGSVEERMLRLQERKRHLADTILGTGSGGRALSEQEIEDLFAPLDAG